MRFKFEEGLPFGGGVGGGGGGGGDILFSNASAYAGRGGDVDDNDGDDNKPLLPFKDALLVVPRLRAGKASCGKMGTIDGVVPFRFLALDGIDALAMAGVSAEIVVAAVVVVEEDVVATVIIDSDVVSVMLTTESEQTSPSDSFTRMSLLARCSLRQWF